MPVFTFWQYLSPQWLTTDLFSSLFYQHSQPPLMNLLIGVVFKASPENYRLILEWIYFGVGLAAVVSLNAALRLIGVRLGLRLFVCVWLCLFPTFNLYMNWAYTTHLEFSLCCMMAYYLARLQRDSRITSGTLVGIFISCCLLGLLRPHWHLTLFMGMGGVLWMFYRRSWNIRHTTAMVAALSPIAIIYLKNLALYGFLGATSWMGANLAGVAVAAAPPSDIKILQAQGEVSAYFPVIFNFDKAMRVREEWTQVGKQSPDYGHPSLGRFKPDGRNNFNYQALIESGKQDMADSLTVMRHYPWSYAQKIFGKMMDKAAYPSIAHVCCRFSLRKLRAFDTEYRDLPRTVKIWMGRGSIMLYAAIPLLVFLLAWLPRGYARERRPFIMITVFVAAAMFVASCAFNKGEQERMRWGTEPFYLIFFAMLLEDAMRRVSHFRSGKPRA